MRRKKNLKKFVAFLLSVIMLLSLCTTVFAEASDSSDGTNADPVICELTEGCILENGHEGECIVNPDVDETEYEDGETKSGVEETVPETVRKFLSAVAAIEIPEEINDETGPILNEQIGAASDAYDALSEEDLKREDVQAAVVTMQLAMNVLTGGAEPTALITGEQFTINVVAVYQNGTVIGSQQLTTTCKDKTGHSGYNHSINLKEFYPSVFGWSTTGWKGWCKPQVTTYTGQSLNKTFYSWDSTSTDIHYNIQGTAPYKAVETIFLVYDNPAPVTYSYTVNHIYRTNGSEDGRTSTTVSNVASGTTVQASSITKQTTYQGNTYSYTSASPTSAAITGNGQTFNLYYDRTVNYNYAINYNTQGGTDVSPTTTSSTAASVTLNVTSEKPEKEGYIFLGWAETATAVAPNAKDSYTLTRSEPTKTLYAVWQEDEGITIDGYSTLNITKKFAGDITSVPENFSMVYSYTDLTTNQTVSGTVALTGNGDTLTGKIQLPYYKNVKDGTTYPLTIVEKNAEVNGYRLVISGSTAMSNLNQDDDSFTYSISATTKSEINRTVTNTYTSIEPETADWDKLTVEKSAAPSGAVKPGDTVTYTISVSNGTGKDLEDINVSEKLNENLEFISASSAQYDKIIGVWTIPALSDGATETLTITAKVKDGVADGTVISNTAVITGAQTDDGEELPDETVPKDEVDITVTNPVTNPPQITIHYQDKDGNPLAEDVVVKVNDDGSYDITDEATKKIIDGWVFDYADGELTGTIDDSIEVIAYYDKDENRDNIADKFQIIVTFRVENGSWNDGSDEEIVEYLTKVDENGQMSENGTAIVENIPAVGEKPAEGYTVGQWDKNPDGAVLTENAVFVYTYEKEEDKPADPTDPTNPENPMDPTNPENPTDPVNPANPTDPTDPENPTDPANPENPTDPVNPANPTDPANPANPTDPVNPVQPTNPANPEQPAQQGNPSAQPNGNTSTKAEQKVTNVPKTGDTMKVNVVVGCIVVSAFVMMFTVVGQRRKNKRQR